MRKTIYLFFIRHVKEEAPCSEEENEKTLQHWRWVEEQIKNLPIPKRAYFDSLDFGTYEETMQQIQRIIKDLLPLTGLTPQQRMMVRLRRKGVLIEPTEDTKLLEDFRSFVKAKLNREHYGKDVHNEFFERTDNRDRFIASQIHKTLGHGETAFLFQGVHHNIQGFLKTDVKLGVYLGDIEPVRREYTP